MNFDIAIVGGGPAGSAVALFLLRSGFSVCILEKKRFPRETVCGEFLSREVLEVLRELHLDDAFIECQPRALHTFRFCPSNYTASVCDLRFPAYAMARGRFDSFMLEAARNGGACIRQPVSVERVEQHPGGCTLAIRDEAGIQDLEVRWVIGAYGKAYGPGYNGNHAEPGRQSHLNGIKFHLPRSATPGLPDGEIQIHTGRDLYCGLNVVDDHTATLSFLERRRKNSPPPRVRIRELQKSNPHFALAVARDIADTVENLPAYGAGNIGFGAHQISNGRLFLTGDAARVIAPLAGDGIGMALQGGKILAATLSEAHAARWDLTLIGEVYQKRWTTCFSRRLLIASQIQRLLLSPAGSHLAGIVASRFPHIVSHLIENTRG